jgi:hypothetical protein
MKKFVFAVLLLAFALFIGPAAEQAEAQVVSCITGTVAGTGSAINVSVGFLPRDVKVWNFNDAGTLWATIEWVYGMGNGKGFKTLKTIDNGVTGLASSAFVSTNGISQYVGSTTAAPGFTIGADADINANTEVVAYKACR